MSFDKNEATKKILLNMDPFHPNLGFGDSKYIACVGSNGAYDEKTIIEGFRQAIKVIISGIAQYEVESDPAIYALCYSIRHYIELQIKSLIHDCAYIYDIKNNKKLFRRYKGMCTAIHNLTEKAVEENINLNSIVSDLENKRKELYKKLFIKTIEFTKLYTHNLQELSGILQGLYCVDIRIGNIYRTIEKYISYYYPIDSAGDAFRYWIDKDLQPNLESKVIHHISALALYTQFLEIDSAFEQIKYLDLVNEYSTGTFTEQLSRSQLESISLELPKFNNWGNELKESKECIMAKYELKIRAFDRALKVIKGHLKFSANIGIEIKFRKISDESLKMYAWASAFQNKTICRDDTINKLAKDGLLSSFDNDDFALLTTYHELYHQPYQQEYLPQYYIQVKKRQPNKSFDMIGLANNYQLVNEIMKLCGQISYVTKLEKWYDYFLTNDVTIEEMMNLTDAVL
jgi:hypothetical protein